MHLSLRILLAIGFALAGPSCVTHQPLPTPYTNYSPLDAYNLGYRHGSADRLAGKTHSPHVNDPAELPSAHRKDYIWGYTQGYKNPTGAGAYSAK